MHPLNFWSLATLLTTSLAADGLNSSELPSRGLGACLQIAEQISGKSEVYYAVSANYYKDQEHYMSSSDQFSECVVEVGSTEDTAKVMKIIGSTRTPFAVKSGGHASNPGFSSTPGVLISLTRLKAITPSADNTSVVIGLGNSWASDVYPKLNPLGYNVVGGRVTGPGTGGFTLGGGFSWLTNQYGLTCDTVQSYTLVLPNGTVANIDASQPDLFFALKGGLNRFGVATQITYNLYPQIPKVYGGYQVFAPNEIPALLSATNQFSATNADPKAQVIVTVNVLAGIPEGILLSFYDGPSPPPEFAPFQKIPALISDVSSRSFSSLASSSPSNATSGTRGAFHTLSTTGLTQGFLNAVYNETTFYGELALEHSGVFVSYDIEPFLKTYGSKATDSAYPHSQSPLPLNLYFAWLLEEDDAYWRGKMEDSVNHLLTVAQTEGIYSADLTAYPNYALSTYQGDQLYGPTNAARLRTIQKQVDPTGIMELAGGFTI